jgi:hypothetical protein
VAFVASNAGGQQRAIAASTQAADKGGDNLSIAGGAAGASTTTTANGGTLSLSAGVGGAAGSAAGGHGGLLSTIGGAGGAGGVNLNAGHGGDITITGGSAGVAGTGDGTGGIGGSITLTGGAATGASTGGAVDIISGAAETSGYSGDIHIRTGVPIDGVSGGIHIHAGDPSGTGTYGKVEIGNNDTGTATHAAITVEDVFASASPSGRVYIGHWQGSVSPWQVPIVAIGRQSTGGLTYLNLGGGTESLGAAQVDGNIRFRASAAGGSTRYVNIVSNTAGLGDNLGIYPGAGFTNFTGGNLNMIAGAYGGTASTIVAFTNALRTAYEAHRVLTTGGVHGAADGVNTVGAASTDLPTAITLLNDIKAKYNLHHVYVVSSVHAGAGDPNTVTAGDATDLATAIVLAEDIKLMYNAHRINVTSVHGIADNTNLANAGMDGLVKIGYTWTSYVLLGTETNGWHIDVAANMFEYRGSGNIRLPVQFWIGTVQCGSTVTATNLNTLTNGSNADALHVHASGSATSVAFTSEVNGEAGTIVQGMAVGVENSTGSKLFKADPTSVSGTRHFVVGLAQADIGTGVTGKVVTSGETTAKDSAWETKPVATDTGKLVWASETTVGKITYTAPTTSGSYKTKVGIITFANASADTTRVAVQIGDPTLL